MVQLLIFFLINLLHLLTMIHVYIQLIINNLYYYFQLMKNFDQLMLDNHIMDLLNIKKIRPVNNIYKITPHDHISALIPSNDLIENISGDI